MQSLLSLPAPLNVLLVASAVFVVVEIATYNVKQSKKTIENGSAASFTESTESSDATSVTKSSSSSCESVTPSCPSPSKKSLLKRSPMFVKRLISRKGTDEQPKVSLSPKIARSLSRSLPKRTKSGSDRIRKEEKREEQAAIISLFFENTKESGLKSTSTGKPKDFQKKLKMIRKEADRIQLHIRETSAAA